jgi:hypothetical protein
MEDHTHQAANMKKLFISTENVSNRKRESISFNATKKCKLFVLETP